ncbi:unnamed protein product [Phaeothamnion confervicola]
MHGFKVNAFRSNGIELQINLIADKEDRLAFSNANGLREAGYDFAEKGPMDAVAQYRGVYTMREGSIDCMPRLPVAEDAVLVVVDKDVLCVRVCQYQHGGNCFFVVSNNDKVWTVNGNENRKMAGADHTARLEVRRPQGRRLRRGHRAALDDAQEDGAAGTVPDGAHRCLPHAATGAVHPRPPQDAWLVSQMRKRYVEVTAKRLVAPTLRSSGGVVTFGDVDFEVGQGGGPKKALVATAARRYMVFKLGEFRTSKMCPGGCGREMVDVQEGVRVRRCNHETAIEDLNPAGARPPPWRPRRRLHQRPQRERHGQHAAVRQALPRRRWLAAASQAEWQRRPVRQLQRRSRRLAGTRCGRRRRCGRCGWRRSGQRNS